MIDDVSNDDVRRQKRYAKKLLTGNFSVILVALAMSQQERHQLAFERDITTHVLSMPGGPRNLCNRPMRMNLS